MDDNSWDAKTSGRLDEGRRWRPVVAKDGRYVEVDLDAPLIGTAKGSAEKGETVEVELLRPSRTAEDRTTRAILFLYGLFTGLALWLIWWVAGCL